MTFNQFKFCCIMFTKTFEGKKYGEIIDSCYIYDSDCLISLKEIKFTFSSKRFGYNIKPALFVYNRHAITIYKDSVADVNFYNIEYFLNHFKIPLDDIV